MAENWSYAYNNGPALAGATVDGRLWVRRLKGVTGVYYIFSRHVVAAIGGYEILPNRWGHEHTEV